MKRLVFILLSLIVLTVGCTRTPATQSPAALDAVVTTLLQALSQGDSNKGLSLLADDVILRQEPSGIEIKGKAPVEANIAQIIGWHRQYTIVGPVNANGDRVQLTAEETGDEYQIMGLNHVSSELNFRIVDGKVRSWTATIDPADWARIIELTAGRVGIKIESTDQGAKVSDVAANSPAYQAGLRPQDIIIAVDGVSFSEMRAGEMQLRIQGPVGSKVKLTVTRNGDLAPRIIEVTRVSVEQLSP
jgi:membrane-associated protease RseP (regulator of RpoE activity)